MAHTNKDIILGIDPGFLGAFVWFNCSTNQPEAVHDTPLLAHQLDEFKKDTRRKKNLDLIALGKLVKTFAARTRFAVIEDVHAFPGQGTVSMFRFGFTTGAIHGVLAANNIRIFKLSPAVWKPRLGLTRDKSQSIALARKLWPDHSNHFTLAKHDGRAEACLLAYTGLNIPYLETHEERESEA